MKKTFLALMLLLWLAVILTLFFVVQKPDFLSILAGLKNLFLTIFIPFLMIALAACMGAYLLLDSDPVERLTLGIAIGMGIFGLTGFGLAISGWAKPFILGMILLTLTGYFIFTGKLIQVWKDTRHVAKEIYASNKNIAPWIPISAGIAIGLAFLMSLAPPIEDFDALLYHLAVPEWWLRDGSLIPSQALTYWYPHIVEGSFVVPMVFGIDTATHLIHLLWLVLTILILWHWARQVWNDSIAWDAIAISLTMPSLLWLASWAYTDYALTFAGIATIYSMWKWRNTENKRWITISGIMAGLAMGMKYTSFVIPLIGVMLIAVWGQGNLQRIKKIIHFSLVAILIASPWYIRNWIWMGNPFYPFVFGGRFWDSFLAQRFSGAGSGIGFDIGALLLLPLTATLGTQDTNFFDGRFGPFFLILLPIALWAHWQTNQKKDEQRQVLLAIYLLSVAGITIWTFGVMNSNHLFQTRYLFPALIPFTIPLSIGLNALYKLDTNRLKTSFIVRSMVAFVVFVNLLNFSLQILVRDPLSVAIGITSRQEYIEKQQPGYASVLMLMKNVPDDAKVYFLFEPRSYGVNAYVQPDAINANFSHDLWLYKTPEKIITSWQRQGYTYVLLSKSGADFIFQNATSPLPNEKLLLEQVKKLLIIMEESKSGDYMLYRIP
jgi:hypothetical protein